MALICADLRRLMDEGAALDASEVRTHLAGCEGCRRAVERWQETIAKLREWGEQPTPPFLHGRLMARLRADGQPRRSWLRRLWWAPTLATIVLVATLGVWRSAEPPPAPQTAVSHPRALATAAPAKSPSERTRPAPTPAVPPERTDGPLRGGSPTPRAVQNVACQLRGAAAGDRRLLELPEGWAPPPGVAWTVVVAASGEVQSAPSTSVGSGEGLIPLEALEALASLDLRPGRYVLERTRGVVESGRVPVR